MASKHKGFMDAVAISEPPPVPPQTSSTDGSNHLLPGGLRGANFEELVALLTKEHSREVGVFKRELERLQEKNMMLNMRLQSLSKKAQKEADAAVSEPTELPNELPRLSTEDESDDVSDRRASRTKSEVEVSSTPISAWEPKGSTPSTAVEHKTSNGNGSARGTQSVRGSRGPLFPLKGVWSNEFNPVDSFTPGSGRASFCIHSLASQDMLEAPPPLIHDSSQKKNKKKTHHGLIGTPTQPPRLAWDFTGAMLIFYDLFKLPMEAFRPPESDFSIGMDWFILIFWTLNVLASITVGHMEHGEMVMDPKKIFIKYLKTWFVVDLLVVLPDWIFTIVALAQAGGSDEDSGDSVKLLRVLRLVRMVRLVRLLKLRKIFDTLNDMINSEYISVIANIVKMIVALLAINHLICCVWFAIAWAMKDEPGTTWIKHWEFDNVHWSYQYTTSFHWSITQFTPASMHIQPQNMTERTFAIVVVIFALVGFSYIVGSITGSLAQLRNMHAEESKLFWDLRRYLMKNKVTERNPSLSLRIQKYLEHAWNSQQESKPVKDVKLMGLLSEQLSSELKYELAVHQLNFHPFLQKLCEFSSVTVHRLSNSAIGHKLLAEGDRLFLPGEAATHMYIVVKGKFRYRKMNGDGTTVCEDVDNGEDWIAEPVLWTESWLHRGLLTAVEESDNLMIESKQFSVQIKLNPQAYLFACGYARNFLDWLNDMSLEDLSDISQGEEVGDTCRSFIPTDIYEDMTPQPKQASKTMSGIDGDRMTSTQSTTSGPGGRLQRFKESFKAH